MIFQEKEYVDGRIWNSFSGLNYYKHGKTG